MPTLMTLHHILAIISGTLNKQFTIVPSFGGREFYRFSVGNTRIHVVEFTHPDNSIRVDVENFETVSYSEWTNFEDEAKLRVMLHRVVN